MSGWGAIIAFWGVDKREYSRGSGSNTHTGADAPGSGGDPSRDPLLFTRSRFEFTSLPPVWFTSTPTILLLYLNQRN